MGQIFSRHLWRWPGDSLWLVPKPQICVLTCPPPTPQSRTESQMYARARTHLPLLRAWQGHSCLQASGFLAVVHTLWAMTESSSTRTLLGSPRAPRKSQVPASFRPAATAAENTSKGPALSFLTCVRIYSYLSSNVSVKMLSGNGDIITRCHGVSGMRPVQPLPPLNLELIREGTEVPGQGCAR